MPLFSRNMYSFLYNLYSSQYVLYKNGEHFKSGQNTIKSIIEWCIERLDVGTSIFLIGPYEKTDIMRQHLRIGQFNICCYEAKQLDAYNISQCNSLDEVLQSLAEIKSLVKNIQPMSKVNISPSNRDSQDIKEMRFLIEKSFENLDRRQTETHYLVQEILNHESSVTSNASIEVIDDLRRELASYKNDFYQKSMLRYGVNMAIEILERLYMEKNLLRRNENHHIEELERLMQIISFCETKMKKLNLRIFNSKEGDEFDGATMITYDDIVATDDDSLRGCVAYSISPAVYWTLPRVNAPGEDELLIKEETVALFK